MSEPKTQTIPTGVATKVSIQDFNGHRIAIFRNFSASSSIYFGHNDTITDASSDVEEVPAEKQYRAVLSPNQELWVYQNSGGDIKISGNVG